MMKNKKIKSLFSLTLIFTLVVCLSFTTSQSVVLAADANLSVVDMSNLTPEDLVTSLLGDGVTVSNVEFTGSNVAAGKFSGGSEIIGFDSGVILSSGSVHNVIGPNQEDGATGVNDLPGDSDLDALIPGYTTNDATILEFDFIPNNNVISFQYVFTSEEYNEYVNTEFNDVFGFFVNGENMAKLPNSDTTVSINNVNGGNPFGENASNSKYFINNDLDDNGGSINTEMDGLLVVLSVEAQVKAGEVNHIKMAIADAGDLILDSNVFIKAGSFSDKPADTDGDGFPDSIDNCPIHYDPNQTGPDDICEECESNKNPEINFRRITGGGTLIGPDYESKANYSFGFNICQDNIGLKANLEYNEGHHGKASTKKGEANPLQIKIKGYASNIKLISTENGTGVEFDIPCVIRTLTSNNEREINTAHIKIVDNGDPGSDDKFNLTIIDGPIKGYTSGASNIQSGNIKIHK